MNLVTVHSATKGYKNQLVSHQLSDSFPSKRQSDRSLAHQSGSQTDRAAAAALVLFLPLQ